MWELFKNAHACALWDCLGVSWPFVSDTSPKCIDQEGLKRRHTGTRQRSTTGTSHGFSPADWSGVLFCWINLDGTRHPIKLWNRQKQLHRLFKSQTSLNDRELNSSNSLPVRRQGGRAVRVLDLQFGGPTLTAQGHPMTVFCKISVWRSKIA